MVQRSKWLRFHQPRRHQRRRFCSPDRHHQEQQEQIPSIGWRRRESAFRRRSR